MYELASRLPRSEQGDLASQIRRACKSIPSNIAEGFGRRTTPREFCRFLSIALGSTNEMEVHLSIVIELQLVDAAEASSYLADYQIVGKQLTKLIQYWRTRPDY
jgi:four helix bundle protein